MSTLNLFNSLTGNILYSTWGFKMSVISDVIGIAFWLLLNSPISFIENYLENLPISFNHDSYLTPPQIIQQHGYPVESHTIRTNDGYLLELHRIPYGKAGKGNHTRYPVLLYHCVLCTSITWIINGPEKSLGYRLADEGYDVWLGNMRGNTFSRAHITLTPEQKEFWDFSFHEIGIHDLPASIDHILNETNHQQLFYIGHSLGSLVFYIMASTLPQYNEKIVAQASLAPGTAMSHTRSLTFRWLVPIRTLLNYLYESHQDGAFLQHDVLEELFSRQLCSITIFGFNFCAFGLFFTFGWNPGQFNNSLMPIISNNLPAGTSIKVLIHVLQYINPGMLTNYDYGNLENLKRYGTPTPPLYNLTNMKVPVRIYYGPNDLLIDPIDIESLYKKIPNPYGLVRVHDLWFGHLDFIWAKDVNKLLNDDVIQFVHNITDPVDVYPNTQNILSISSSAGETALSKRFIVPLSFSTDPDQR